MMDGKKSKSATGPNPGDGPPPVVGVDIGGTFTDFVYTTADGLRGFKLLSSVMPEEAVLEGLDRIRTETGSPAGALLFHGMTVGTNTALERKGARTALLTTEGFQDLVEIGRQNRPELYALWTAPEESLSPPDLRFAVPGRMGPRGEIRPLDRKAVERIARELKRRGAESVAVGFLHSYRDGAHERAARDILKKTLETVPVSLSHEAANEFREVERISTALVDAYIKPRMAGYLGKIEAGARRRGVSRMAVMTSAGWSETAAAAAAHPVRTLLSGPAGGVNGARRLLGEMGFPDLLTFDMGGTSADVSIIRGGEAALKFEGAVGPFRVKTPMLDIETVGAGGGSVAWVDEGRALRVGPRSSGGAPGPACYGRGGTEPTVTDANLALGRLPDGMEMGEGVRLDRARAEAALRPFAKALGLPLWKAAAGIVRVANAHMLASLRRISVDRGVDPSSFRLVAFGGAGPLHATALAAGLGARGVVVPAFSGMFSALGLIVSEDVRHAARAVLKTIGKDDRALASELRKEAAALESGVKKTFDGFAARFALDLRYKGQSHELNAPAESFDPQKIKESFHALHESRFGFRIPGAEVEIVNLRLFAERPGLAGLPVRWNGGGKKGRSSQRSATAFRRLDGRMSRGSLLALEDIPARRWTHGPALAVLPGATLILEDGWKMMRRGAFVFLERS